MPCRHREHRATQDDSMRASPQKRITVSVSEWVKERPRALGKAAQPGAEVSCPLAGTADRAFGGGSERLLFDRGGDQSGSPDRFVFRILYLLKKGRHAQRLLSPRKNPDDGSSSA